MDLGGCDFGGCDCGGCDCGGCDCGGLECGDCCDCTCECDGDCSCCDCICEPICGDGGCLDQICHPCEVCFCTPCNAFYSDCKHDCLHVWMPCPECERDPDCCDDCTVCDGGCSPCKCIACNRHCCYWMTCHCCWCEPYWVWPSYSYNGCDCRCCTQCEKRKCCRCACCKKRVHSAPTTNRNDTLHVVTQQPMSNGGDPSVITTQPDKITPQHETVIQEGTD